MKIHYPIIIALGCTCAWADEPIALQRGQAFSHARKAILAKHWKPVVPRQRKDEPIGVEKDLLRNKIREFDACSVDARAYCIFRYAHGAECLTLFTAGDNFDSMKVTSWNFACS